jgi:hypothetical protein
MVDLRLTLHTALLRRISNQTDEDLFLAEKIEVGVTAGAGVDDGGKVPREIVCVTTLIR